MVRHGQLYCGSNLRWAIGLCLLATVGFPLLGCSGASEELDLKSRGSSASSGRVDARGGGEVDEKAMADLKETARNLARIGRALHAFYDANRHFPPAYVADSQGKPLLSWRVLLLPYLGEEELFRQFRLNEPWDSPHNKQLIEKIPAVYRTPGSKVPLGKTNYLALAGPNTAFRGTEMVRMPDIRDGPSNTALVVEVKDAAAVEWTRPMDLAVDDPGVLQKLVGFRLGILILLADGRVEALRIDIEPAQLQALASVAGGELIDSTLFYY